MYYVYVLLCSDRDLYIGYSDNLRKRIEAHNKGKVKFTKSKRPLILVYYEAYRSKKDATKQERFLKTHQQKELLKSRINNSLMAW